MQSIKMYCALSIVVLLVGSGVVFAVPTFQVYAQGASAGDWGPDEDTWLVTSDSFNLVVVGAYGPSTQSLTEVTLLVSVPKGETGAIYISGSESVPLLTVRTPVSGGYYNPNSDADIDILTNESGNGARYDGYSTESFIPDGVNFNEHYPFKETISNFVLYGMGSFGDVGDVNNYDAESGVIGTGAGTGEEKVFDVSVEGFSWVHFDAYGYEYDELGRKIKSTWDISPGSHDATQNTVVPAPGAVLLGGIGVAFVGWLRRRHAL